MKNSFYFDHDYNSRNDQKILEVRAEFGWEGYAIFFAILECMCESKGYIKREALGGLSLGLNMPKDMLIKLIDFYIKIGLFHEGESGIFSNRILAHLAYREKLSISGSKGGRGNKKPPFSHPLASLEAGKESKGKESKEESKNNIFIPPTLKEVSEYCTKRQNNVDPAKFIDFYIAKGWMVGKNKMKDWMACVRTWEKSNKSKKINDYDF